MLHFDSHGFTLRARLSSLLLAQAAHHLAEYERRYYCIIADMHDAPMVLSFMSRFKFPL